jgi:N-acetylglucosamine malate deacetylase 1
MNILVIAPHPDDESIGCGGTVCKYTARGDRVTVAFLTSGELGLKKLSRENARETREAEAGRAAKILGIAALEFFRLPDWSAGNHVEEGARLLVPILRRERPETIYLPHPRESHPDHKAALPILQAASRKAALAEMKLLGYEVWTPISEQDSVENISDTILQKLRAVRAHRSQLEQIDYARAVRGLNEYRGEMAGHCRYAEVFQTLSLNPTEESSTAV